MTVIFGNLGGELMKKGRLPPLLGMLIMGYILRNFVPGTYTGLTASENSLLRTVALGVIMISGGMSLDIPKLCRYFHSMVILSWFPCLCEAVTIACIVRVLFPYMGWVWGIMLGFVIADVSPAITTPLLLFFQTEKYGTKKGIPSILICAGSVNSVFAIVLYSVAWELAWDGDANLSSIIMTIFVKFFVQIFGVGLGAGGFIGFLTSKIWSVMGTDRQDTDRSWARFLLVSCVAMSILFSFKQMGLAGGGTLATLTFGASLQKFVNANHLTPTTKVQNMISVFWDKIGSVVLFTLLGASIDQSQLDVSMVGLGVIAIIVGLTGRSIGTILSCAPLRHWNRKEKAFAVVSWCPKATVQAALANKALDHVKLSVAAGKDNFMEGSDYVEMMKQRSMVILTLAVLSIILTAPLFAVLMDKLGRKWLQIEEQDMPDLERGDVDEGDEGEDLQRCHSAPAKLEHCT